MGNNLNDYLTCREVAELCGFTSDYIRYLIGKGQIRAIKTGHIWLIHKNDIKHLKRQRHYNRGKSNGRD